MSNVGKGPNGYVFTASGEGSTAGGKFLAIGTKSGLTQHGIVLSQGAGAFTSTGPGTLGYILTSTGSGDPTFQPVSSTGAVLTITGNSGGAKNPSSSNFNILGTGSITSVGTTATETIQLTGLTNHAVLVGAGTATITKVGPTATAGQILQSSGAAADPAFSTATYPLTTTISQILYSSSDNVVSGLATTNRASLSTNSTGVPTWLAMTDGQVIIGSTSGSPAAGTITSTGGTITVTAGSNTLNLEVVTGGFTWTDVTGATQSMSVENGYITDRGAGVVYTLPATASLGSEIIVIGKLGITTITPNANQQILMSSASGTVGVTGTIVGTNVGDCVTLIATTSGASTVWRASSFVGNWTVS